MPLCDGWLPAREPPGDRDGNLAQGRAEALLFQSLGDFWGGCLDSSVAQGLLSAFLGSCIFMMLLVRLVLQIRCQAPFCQRCPQLGPSKALLGCPWVSLSLLCCQGAAQPQVLPRWGGC